MTDALEYHTCVRPSFPASFLSLSLIVMFGLLVATSQAQINGAPASVTSPGFGGHSVNGAPASVTSLGPRGFAPNPPVRFSTTPHPSRNPDPQHRHHRTSGNGVPFLYAVPVPYAVDNGQDRNPPQDYADDGEVDPQYQGGPTVFDRRGAGGDSYVPPVGEVKSTRTVDRTESASMDPEPAQDPTLLVFRDGHMLEVGNYAIVGVTLFDLTPGHSRKVALADLDLVATRKQNDDRGVVFQLPPSLQGN